ncbi:MAG: DUF350 domain-containing protein [Opitutaceae bacterium]|nr:DUF350 domain-containing protein [Opitutaceae bacterium]
MKEINSNGIIKIFGAAVVALALTSAASAAEGTSSWAAVAGSLGGLLLGVIQLIVGLSMAAFSITKGLKLLSKLLGGIDIWEEVKNRNTAVALLGAGVVVSYTRVISGGIAAMSDSLATLGTGSVFNGAIGLVSGLINLAVAIGVASFAITVVFRVMDKLTITIDEKAEFKKGNVAIGAVYCGILIGVSSLVAAGVSGIGSGVSVFLSALVGAIGG